MIAGTIRARGSTGAGQPDAAWLDILQELYRATLQPDYWQGLIDATTALLGGPRVMFIQVDRTVPSASMTEASGIPEQHLQALRERDLSQDYVWQAVLALPAGAVRRTTDLWPGDLLTRGPLYESVAVPAGLLYGLTANLENNAAFFTNICALRPEADFTAAQADQLARLVPHLQTALQIGRRIALGEAGRREALLRFERARQAIVVLDRSGYAIHASQAARDTLRKDAGLVLKFGRFIFDVVAEQAEFERAVRAAVSNEKDNGAGEAYHMRLRRRGADPPLGLSIIALRNPTDRALLPDGAGCLVLIDDVGQLPPLPVERLSALYGLTRAEGRICEALYRTGAIDAAARDLHLTRHTVRSHLKAIYPKFGVTTQGQLMQRLGSTVRLAVHGGDLPGD